MVNQLEKQESTYSGHLGKWDCIAIVGCLATVGIWDLYRRDIDKGNKPRLWGHYDPSSKRIEGGANF